MRRTHFPKAQHVHGTGKVHEVSIRTLRQFISLLFTDNTDLRDMAHYMRATAWEIHCSYDSPACQTATLTFHTSFPSRISLRGTVGQSVDFLRIPTPCFPTSERIFCDNMNVTQQPARRDGIQRKSTDVIASRFSLSRQPCWSYSHVSPYSQDPLWSRLSARCGKVPASLDDLY